MGEFKFCCINKLKLKNLLVITAFAFCACDCEDGYNSIISTEIELAGENCEVGGIKINYGKDENRNDILECYEIEHSDFICNNQDGNIELDNLTRIELGSPNVTACNTDWTMSKYETFHYPDFNKKDYSGVSSILFVPSIVNHESKNRVTVELYNVTDGISILNSKVNHRGTYAFKYSENIYKDLPDYPITLGIRIKNSKPDACGGLGARSYLYILRE